MTPTIWFPWWFQLSRRLQPSIVSRWALWNVPRRRTRRKEQTPAAFQLNCFLWFPLDVFNQHSHCQVGSVIVVWSPFFTNRIKQKDKSTWFKTLDAIWELHDAMFCCGMCSHRGYMHWFQRVEDISGVCLIHLFICNFNYAHKKEMKNITVWKQAWCTFCRPQTAIKILIKNKKLMANKNIWKCSICLHRHYSVYVSYSEQYLLYWFMHFCCLTEPLVPSSGVAIKEIMFVVPTKQWGEDTHPCTQNRIFNPHCSQTCFQDIFFSPPCWCIMVPFNSISFHVAFTDSR